MIFVLEIIIIMMFVFKSVNMSIGAANASPDYVPKSIGAADASPVYFPLQ